MRPLFKPTMPRKVVSVRADLGREQRKPMAGEWYAPALALDPNVPQVPLLKNSFVQPGDPIQQHEFRWNMNGALEFRGHVKLGVASSGKVAYTLPGAIVGKPNFLPDEDFSFRSYAISKTGVYVPARYHVNSVTGDVTVTQESGLLPFAALGWSSLVTPQSVPTATTYFLGGGGVGFSPVLDPTKIGGYTTDDQAFNVNVGGGTIFPLDEEGVYLVTAVAYWDVSVPGRKIVGVTWPVTRLSSSGAFTEVETATSVHQHTEHRWVGGEGLEGFTMRVEQQSGSNKDLIGASIEITRLVDEVQLVGIISY